MTTKNRHKCRFIESDSSRSIKSCGTFYEGTCSFYFGGIIFSPQILFLFAAIDFFLQLIHFQMQLMHPHIAG